MTRPILMLFLFFSIFAATPQTMAQDVSSMAKNLTLHRLDGKLVKFGDISSRVTVVAVWATWCEPCIRELPYVDALYHHYSKSKLVSVVALNVDSGTYEKNASSIESLKKKMKLSLPMFLQPEEKLTNFLTTGKIIESSVFRFMQLPLVAIVDAKGKVMQKTGFEEGLSKEAFIQEYKKLVTKALKGFLNVPRDASKH